LIFVPHSFSLNASIAVSISANFLVTSATSEKERTNSAAKATQV
jgi:hypothetical protein